MKVKKNIKLQQACAGQILANEVSDAQGHCLMAAGVELSTANLARLQKRGIEILTVWGEQQLSEAEITAQQLAIESRLAHRFRQMRDNPEMHRLHDILLAYRMEYFEEQGKGDKK